LSKGDKKTGIAMPGNPALRLKTNILNQNRQISRKKWPGAYFPSSVRIGSCSLSPAETFLTHIPGTAAGLPHSKTIKIVQMDAKARQESMGGR